MMQKNLLYGVLVAVCLLSPLNCVQAQAPLGFYTKKAQGWFWYEAMPAEQKSSFEPSPPATASSSTNSSQAPPSTVSLTPLSAAWFRQNLPRYKDAAWDHPIPDNMHGDEKLAKRLGINDVEACFEKSEK